MSPVFALATPPAKSAICIFRVSGDGCLEKLKELTDLKKFDSRTFKVVNVFNKGVLIDKAGLVLFKGPNSYTGEDSFEIYAHGSLGVMSSLVEVFKGVGFEEAPGGEFTKRAFLNNKISLNEAEAISDLIDVTDDRGVTLSGGSLFGEMSKKVQGFANTIDQIRVRVEAEIDFSDEGDDFMGSSCIDELKDLVGSFGLFIGSCVNKKLYSQKSSVLLIGPVNTGKSSIFNRLLGFKRAIVSNTPGTTRDLIESEVFYETSSFSITDSAGIRNTEDSVESEGIEISLSEINKADLVVGVFEDYDKNLIKDFETLCKDVPYISLQNKIDINSKKNNYFDCCVSAKTGEGFGLLKNLIVSNFNGFGVDKKKYNFMIRDRHENLFLAALEDLNKALLGLNEGESLEIVAEDLRLARSHLDEVVGKTFSDSLLGEIFNSFCIGK